MRRISPLLLLSVLTASLAFLILWKGGKTLESTWLLTGVAACVAFLAHWLPQKERTKGVFFPTVVFLFLFLAWSLASFFLSDTSNYGLDEILRDASLAGIFLSLLSLDHGSDLVGRARNWTVSAVSLSAVLAAVIGACVYVLQPVDRFVGTFFDFRFHTDYWPNAWAEFLLLAWPLVVLWVQPWRAKMRYPRLLLLGFVLGTLLLSYSRGGFLSFAGQLMLFALFALWQKRKHLSFTLVWKTVAASVAVAIVAVLTFLALNGLRSQFFPVQSVEAKVTFTADEGTSSIDERAEFWQQAMTLTEQKPWFGHGPYSFRFVQPALQQGILATADHPHNVFLKLSSERGIPAAVFFGCFLLAVLLPMLVLLARGKDLFFESAAVVSVAGVLAHNQIDYNLQFIGIALPFWILLALIAGGASFSKWNLKTGLARAVAFFLAGLCIFVSVREAPYLLASSQGRALQASGKLSQALAQYQLAGPQWLPRDLQLSKMEVLLALHRLPEAEMALKKYRQENPVDPRTYTIAGFLSLSEKNPKDALTEFSQAFLRGGQDDASILRGLLLCLRDLKQPSLNAQWQQKIIGTLEQYTNAIKDDVHFIALSDNVEQTVQAIGLAKIVYPSFGPELATMDHAIETEAAKERARLQSRSTGMLWQ